MTETTHHWDDRRMFSTGDLALFLGGSHDSFTGKLLELIAKAQATPGNYSRLKFAFPREVRAWETWNSMSPAPTFRELREALQEQDAELASPFQPGDMIAVPPGVVRITGFRETSRLRIKSFRASMKAKECKACGTAIRPGDLYASSTEPSSDRCIRCVDGWPLAR